MSIFAVDKSDILFGGEMSLFDCLLRKKDGPTVFTGGNLVSVLIKLVDFSSLPQQSGRTFPSK